MKTGKKTPERQENNYQSRHKYTGYISGSKYIPTNEFSDDVRKITKTDDETYKNWALLIGYCGTRYIGNQRQPWCLAKNTIEEELLKAMLKCNWITEEAFWKPWKVKIQHASRTDTGVSAARQIYSMFMCMYEFFH